MVSRYERERGVDLSAEKALPRSLSSGNAGKAVTEQYSRHGKKQVWKSAALYPRVKPQYLRDLEKKNPNTFESRPSRLASSSAASSFILRLYARVSAASAILLRWPSTVPGAGPSPNLIGFYCFVNLIFRDTSPRFNLLYCSSVK